VGVATARAAVARKYVAAMLIPSWIVFELVTQQLPALCAARLSAIAILTVGALNAVLSAIVAAARRRCWFVIRPAASVISRRWRAITLTRQSACPHRHGRVLWRAAADLGLFAWWLTRQSRRTLAAESVVAAMFLR